MKQYSLLGGVLNFLQGRTAAILAGMLLAGSFWLCAFSAKGQAWYYGSPTGAVPKGVEVVMWQDFESPWTSSNTPAGGKPSSGWSKFFATNHTDWVRATNGINGNPVRAWGTGRPSSNVWVNPGTGTSNWFARFGTNSYGNVTRLYTPPMDLSKYMWATLSFWHIQVPWPADQDYLRIRIATNATPNILQNYFSTAGWQTLAFYTAGETNWKARSLALTNALLGTNVVIAFEGVGEYAYGTCVDDVLVFAGTNASPDDYVTCTSLWQDFETPWTASNTPAGGYPATGWSKLIMSNNTDWIRITNGINGNPGRHRTNAWINGTTGSSNWFARFGAGSYGNVTRLYTPRLDLTGAEGVKLRFWHIQVPWPADQDYLRVLYTTNATPMVLSNSPATRYAGWNTLAYYTAGQTTWVERVLAVTNGISSNMVFAFEGIGEYAYGTCIDDVQVTCQSNATRRSYRAVTNLWQDFETPWTASNTPAGGYPSAGWSKMIMSNNTDWVRATNGINGNPGRARNSGWAGTNTIYTSWTNPITGTAINFARFGAASYGNVTRLYTPILDLSEADRNVATLTFWHCQFPWPADQDYLRVLYTTNATAANMYNTPSTRYMQWTTLAYYTAGQTSWVERTLILTNVSTNVVVAFEGIGEYAYGTCIDDVKIACVVEAGAPTPSVPGLLAVSPASLSFNAAYGGGNPAGQNFTVSNSGPGAISWSSLVQYGSGGSGWFTPSSSGSALASGAVATVSGTVNISGLNVGTYTATNVISSDNATNSPQRLAVALTIGQGSQAITFPQLPDQDATAKVGLQATASSGLAVTFSVGSGPASISGGTNLTFSNTGSVTIYADQAGNANWSAAPRVTNAFNVVAGGQTITFPAIPLQHVTGKVGLRATASSGLPVEFSVLSGPGVIASGTNLSFTDGGRVMVVAAQTGNTDYAYTAVTNNVSVWSISTNIGPFAGGNMITIRCGDIGNGADITSVLVGGQVAMIQAQDMHSVTFMMPTAGSAGPKDIAITSSSKGTLALEGVYTYNVQGVIGGGGGSVVGLGWSSVGQKNVPGFTNAVGMNNTIYGLSYDQNRRILYAGGAFTNAGGSNVYRIARWDGTNWTEMAGGVVKAANVNWVAVGANGTAFAGGYFTNIGGTTTRAIAKWTGTNWVGLNKGWGLFFSQNVNGYVNQLLEARNGDVYAVGYFTNWVHPGVGGGLHYVARWIPSSGTWTGLNLGLNNVPLACLEDTNGNIIVGGSITNVWRKDMLGDKGILDMTYIGIWQPQQQSWTNMAKGFGNRVTCLALGSNGVVYAGGWFTNYMNNDGVKRGANYVAKWDPVKKSWTNLGGGFNNWVYTLAVDRYGTLYAGGSFTNANGYGPEKCAANRIAKFDGVNWTNLGGGLSDSAQTLAIDMTSDDVYVGGFFREARQPDGSATNAWYVARWGQLQTAPSGTGVEPSSGSHTGGYPVVITGTSLGNGSDVTNVTLCGYNVNSIQSQSATQVVVIAGVASSGATGDVRVFSTSFGQTIKANAFTYLFTALPDIRVLGTNYESIASGEAASAAKGGACGRVRVGESATFTFKVENSGTDTLAISGLTTNGTGAAQFQAVNFNPASLPPGGSSNLLIRFSPAAAGVHTAQVQLVNNTAVTPFVLNFTGAGWNIAPTSGAYAGGTTVALTNGVMGNGSDITNVLVGGQSATITGQGANWVRFTTPVAPASGAQDVVVQSTSQGLATFAGAFSYNLRPAEFVLLGIDGQAITNTQPTSLPAGTAFGNVSSNLVLTNWFTLYNPGERQLYIESWTRDGDALKFPYSSGLSRVEPGTRSNFWIAFTPGVAGNYASRFDVSYSNETTLASFYFYISGTGIVAAGGSGSSNVTAGAGATANAGNDVAPVNNWYRSRHGQMIYTASELATAGMPTGAVINQCGFYIIQRPIDNLPSYLIRIKHTTATDMSAGMQSTDLLTVYSNASYAPVEGGFDMLGFSTNFTWNGTNNILVDWAFNIVGYSQTGSNRMDSTTSGMAHLQSDTVDQRYIFTGATIVNTRPQIRFGLVTAGGVGNLVVLGTNAAMIANGDAASRAKGSDFGALAWTAALTNIFSITNSGTAVLGVTSWTTNGPGAAAYRVTGVATGVAVGAVTNFNVVFQPQGSGAFPAWITFNNSGPSPFRLYLSGTGLAARIAVAGDGAFGQVLTGASLTRTFSLFNDGNQPLNISGVTTSGTGAASFQCSAIPSSVSAGGASAFTVTFTPAYDGAKAAVLNFASDATNASYVLNLTGSGYTEPRCIVLGINGEAIAKDEAASTAKGNDFGIIPRDTPMTKTFTITNSGNATLTISSSTIFGTGASKFTKSGVPASVAAGAAASFSVTFRDTAGGIFTAQLRIYHNVSDQPYVLNLRAQGQLPGLDFTTLPVTNATDGSLYLYQPVAQDLALPSATITYSASNLPAWLSFNPGGGSFTISTLAGKSVAQVVSGATVYTSGYTGEGGAATNADFNAPGFVAADSRGNVYVADVNNYRIRKVDGSGIVTLFAGDGSATFSGAGGAATNAGLGTVQSLAVDARDNLYFATASRIAMIDTNGILWHIGGSGASGFSGEGGPATNAAISPLAGLAVNSAGEVYFNTVLGGSYWIAKIDTNRILRSVLSGLSLNALAGMAVDSANSIYFAETALIRRLATNGVLTTAITNITATRGLAVGADGTIYVVRSMSGAARVYAVDAQTNVTLIAGNGTSGLSGDGGTATNAALAPDLGLALGTLGQVYLADKTVNRVRMLSRPLAGLSGTPTPAFAGTVSTVLIHAVNSRASTQQVFTIAVAGLARPSIINRMNNIGFSGDGTAVYQSFGSVATNENLTLTLALTNSGSAALIMSGSNGVYGAFGVAGLPAALAAGAVSNFQVTYYPSALALQQSAISLAHNGTNTPLVLTVDGLGLRPGEMGVDKVSLQYAATYGGANPDVQTITLTNKGAVAYTYTNVVLNGAWLGFTPGTASLAGASSVLLTGAVNIASLGGGTHFTTNRITSGASNSYIDVQVRVDIAPVAQSITFTPLGDQAITATPGLSASASSGLAVTFKVTDGAAQLADNTNLSFQAGGFVTLEISQAGNGNYLAAPTLTNRFEVLNPAVTITITNAQDRPYNGAPVTDIGVTTTPAGVECRLTFNGSTNVPVNAGVYEIQAQAADWRYTGSAVATMQISQAAATIALDNLNQVYNGTARAAAVTTTPEGLSYEVRYAGGLEVPIQAGAYTVTVSLVDGNYTGGATDLLTVAKAEQTITYTMLGDQATTSEVYLAASASSGLLVAYTVIAGPAVVDGGNNLSFTNEGSVSLLIAQDGDSNWNAAPRLTNTFTVSKTAAQINFSGTNAVYDGNAKSVVVDTVPSLLNVVVTYDGSLAAPSNAGVYAVTGTIVEANYEGTAAGTLTIARGTDALVFSATNQVYDGTARTVTAASAQSQPITLTYNGALDAPTNVGVYAVTGLVDTLNWEGLGTTELTVVQGTQAIDFVLAPSAPWTSIVGLSATAGSGLPVAFSVIRGAAAISDGTNLSFSGVGEVQIRAEQAGDANWLPASAVEQTIQAVGPILVVKGTNDEAMASAEPVSVAKGTRYRHLPLGQALTNRFLILNTGSGAMEITGYALAGPDAAQFAVSPLPASIHATSAAPCHITYQPVVLGDHTAQLIISNDSATAVFVLNLAGAAYTLSTNIGPYAGGNSVTITNGTLGDGTNITSVTVGGIEGDITAQGANWVVFTVPPATNSGLKDLVINSVTAGGTLLAGAYTVNPAGVIEAVVPASGSVGGGYPVTIRGSNLGDGGDITNVTLRGLAAAIVSQSATQVVVTAAATLVPGGGDVVVQSLSFGVATAADGFTYTAPGQLVIGANDLVVASGAAPSLDTGTDYAHRRIGSETIRTFTITNNGTETLDIAGWATNGAGAASFEVTGIPSEIPAGTTVTFQVAYDPAAIGQHVAALSISNNSPVAPYVVNLAGSSYGLMPVSGPSAGGNTIVITNGALGDGADITEVLVGGNAATILDQGVNWVEIAMPAGAKGTTVGVSILSTSVGKTTLPESYIYNPAGSIALVAPASGSVTGGYPVTITGGNLCDGTDVTNVTLCGVAAAVVSQSATQIIVTAGIGTPGLGDVKVWSVNFEETSRANAFRYRGEQTITFPAIPDQPLTGSYGLAATADSTLPVTFAVLSGSASISDGTNLTFSGLGAVQVVASQTGDTDWYPAPDKTNAFTVVQAGASVYLLNLTQTYNGAAKSVTATTDPSGLLVQFTYNGAAAAPSNAGTYAVTGTISDATYQGWTNGMLTIEPAEQTIVFSPIPNQLATNVVELGATASSGLPVGFVVLDGPGFIVGSTLAFTNAGTVSVMALQAGNANWNPAPDVTNTFIVAKASAGLTLTNLAQVYDGTVREAGYSSVPSGLSVLLTYDGNTWAPTNVGSYWVTGTVAEALYQGSEVALLTVAKGDQTLSNFLPTNESVFGFTQTAGLSAEASSGLAPVFAVVDGPGVISGGTNLSFTDLCDVSVVASQPGDANWNPVAPLTNTFAVVGGEISLFGVDMALIASGDAPTAAHGTDFGTVATNESSQATLTLANTGTADLTISAITTNGAGAAAFSIEPTTFTLAIGADTNLDVTCAPNVLGALAASFSLVSDGLPTNFELRVAAAGIKPGEIGLNSIFLSYEAVYGGTNPAESGYVITNKGIAAFAYSNTVVYGQGDGWFTINAVTGLLAEGAVQAHTGAVSLASLNAGTYRATNTVSSPTAVNSPVDVVVELMVAKATQAVSFAAIGDQITTNVLGLAATASSGLPVSFSVGSGPGSITDGTNLSFTGAGAVSLVAAQAGDTNYLAAPSVTNAFNVTKAVVEVAFTNLAQTYDGTPRVAGHETTPAGLAVLITYDGGYTAPTAPGSYALTGVVDHVLYAGSQTGTLVVGQATAGVYLASLARTYDGLAKAASVTTDPSGLVVDFTYDGNAWAPTNVGSYAVTGTINDVNYAGAAAATLVISKADQTIDFAAMVNQLASNKLGLAATASSGLPVSFAVGSGPASITDGTNLAFTGAGAVSLVASQPGDTNWNAAPDVTNAFNVSKATASVTVTNLSQVYDGTAREAGYSSVPSGLSVLLTYNGNAWAPTNAGSYAVTGVVNDAIFAGSAVDTLVIARAEQTITDFLPTNGSVFARNESAGLSATASSGFAVAFSVGSGPGAIADGTNLTFTGAGAVSLVAAQAGDANYSAAPDVTNVYNIGKGLAEVTLLALTQAYNGSGRVAKASTVPGDLLVEFTYDGNPWAPTNVGSYALTGTVNDANWEGSATGTLTIIKGGQSIVNFLPADGTALGVMDTVGLGAQASSGLGVSFAVGSGPGSLAGGTNLSFSGQGTVTIVASQAGDSNWDPAPDATNTYPVGKSTAPVYLQDLFQVYNGTARAASATTDPSGLTVEFTYGGNAWAPTNAGSYAVSGTVNDVNWQGYATGILVVAKATQSISAFLPTNGSAFQLSDAPGLSASASSSLPVGFNIQSGPGTISGGTNLAFNGIGLVYVLALQAGDDNWAPAPEQTNVYTVLGYAEVTIASAHGSTIPVTGVYTMLVGTVFTNQVQTPDTQGTTQYVCHGWVATENLDPAGGSGTQAVVTVNGAGTLTWLWNTEYYLTPSAGPHGSIDRIAGWFTNSAVVDINATPDAYYHFTNWTGSVLSYDNPLNLLMDEAKWVTANFEANWTTNKPTPEWWLAQFGITNNQEQAVGEDPDDDGVPTGDEFIMNTDPTNGASFLFAAEYGLVYGTNCFDVVFTNSEPPYDVFTNIMCDVVGQLVGWPCATDRVYDVQYDLALPPGTWSPVAGMTNLVPAGDWLIVTNGLDGSAMHYYRLRVRLP